MPPSSASGIKSSGGGRTRGVLGYGLEDRAGGRFRLVAHVVPCQPKHLRHGKTRRQKCTVLPVWSIKRERAPHPRDQVVGKAKDNGAVIQSSVAKPREGQVHATDGGSVAHVRDSWKANATKADGELSSIARELWVRTRRGVRCVRVHSKGAHFSEAESRVRALKGRDDTGGER